MPNIGVEIFSGVLLLATDGANGGAIRPPSIRGVGELPFRDVNSASQTIRAQHRKLHLDHAVINASACEATASKQKRNQL